MSNGYDEKSVEQSVVTRSVQDIPGASPNNIPSYSAQQSLLWFVGASSDEITPWGQNPKKRDRELREFITTEPILASALGLVCSRNAAFRWTMDGPEEEVRKYKKILENSNFGRGWDDMVMKVSIDLYSQDTGAFIEVIRDGQREEDEIIGLGHLDSGRCFHTGSYEAPVIYMDRKGRYHLLRWWQVIPLAEMPSGIEGLSGVQYCALTRLLRAAQVAKNTSIYEYERTGGLQTRSIHLLKGITASQVNEAIDEMRNRLAARGQMRFASPLMVGTIDPKADIGHDTLELAGLPDKWERDSAMKWYISQIAMAFLEDYQTFAPLPGGNLGSSQQSEVLHANARGKGPGLFRSLIEHALNAILPESLAFRFAEQDLAQELEEARVKKMRAEERSIRIGSFEIPPEAARQLAYDDGDLPEELFQALGGYDLTPDVTVQEGASAESQLGPQDAPVRKLQAPSNNAPPPQRARPRTSANS